MQDGTNRKTKRRRGKKRHSSYILLYIALGLAAAIVLCVLSLTVFFPIKEIRVEGKTQYSKDQIIDASRLPLGTNLFTTDTGAVNDNVTRKLPYIASAEVSRSFPFSLVIRVKAAANFAQIEANGKFYIIDNEAKCLDIKEKAIKGLPLIRGEKTDDVKAGEAVKLGGENSERTALITQTIAEANKRGLPLTVVNFSEEQGAWATYDDRIVFLFGAHSSMDEKLEYAKKVIDQRADKNESGTLNLSRIPNVKNQVSFITGELKKEQKAAE
ncbi:MAG: cell division protein FtsQ/DivIB [Acutalibacteraceae bacterium]